MKFLPRMFTVFLERQKPDSTSANPAFIQNTRNPATITHNVSTITFTSAGVSSSAPRAPDAGNTIRANNTSSHSRLWTPLDPLPNIIG